MSLLKLLLPIIGAGILTSASDAQSIFTNGFPAGLPAPVAIGAVGSINFQGNGVATDSYDSTKTNLSTNGQYDSTKTSTNGNVASVQGLMNLGAHTINGSLYLGPTATYVGSGTVSGTIDYNSNVQFPDVALPSGAGSWPTAAATSLSTTNSKGKISRTTLYDFQTSGSYILTTDAYPIYVEPGVTVNLNVTSTTFAPSDLEIHSVYTNSGTIYTNSGTAYLYLNGPTSVGIAGNSAIDANNRPDNLWYFGLPTLTSITYSGTSSFVGVIYAPEASLTLNTGGSGIGLVGSVIVNTLNINGHCNFHFDESLASGFWTSTNVWIILQPSNQTVPLGSNAAFSVLASGKAPIWYQWFVNQTNMVGHGTNTLLVSGTNYPSLTLTNVQFSDAGNYFVIVSNAYNSVTSSVATLKVVVPPTITAQPTNLLVFPGTNVAFGVSLTGSTPFMYQWQFNGTNLLNATNAIYTISSVTTNNAGNYSLVVANTAGIAASSNAALTVVVSPNSQSNSASSTVTFTVNAFGPELLNYQWQKNGTNLVDGGNISGSTNSQLTIANISDADAANYSAVVSDATSSLTTSNASLTVIDSPFIVTQPLSQSVLVGSDVTFSATVFGAPPLVFQWYYNNAPVGLPTSGTNVSFYTVTNAQTTDSGSYSVQVMNDYDSVMSSNATLTVNPPVPPSITAQPTNLTLTVGSSATFSVTASGTAPLTYQWQFNGTNLADGGNISGSATSTLTITNVSFSHAGNYSVLVTNIAGSDFSSNALLAVNPLPPVPIVASFSPQSGTVGATININGLNFDSTPGNNAIYFGAVQANVLSASPTSLQVMVPVGATFAPITVTVNGLTAYASQPFLPTFPGSGQINISSLAPFVNLATGNGPIQVVIKDLDGDGKPDLIIANAKAGGISIFRNISTNGSLTAGSFAPRVDVTLLPSSGSNPYGIAAADLDGDGRPDIIALNADSNVVSILRNISSPGSITTNSFAARIDLPAGNVLRGLAVQDLNGDGKPEIVTANQTTPGSISIFQNMSTIGNIAFATRVDFATGNGSATVTIGDLDGDGQPDLVVANYNSATISVFRNLGTGGNISTNSFAPKVDFPALASPFPIAIGDMDGDGKLDLVVGGNNGSQAISVYRNTATPGSITTNSFAPRVDFAAQGWVNTLALADLDGDGKLDVALASQLSSVFSIFKNVSVPGSFTTASLAARVDYSAGYNPNGVAIGDLDGDGRPDIIFGNFYDNTISIYRNIVPFAGPPIITSQPTNLTVTAGGMADFSVTASNATPFSYQWQKNGTNLVDGGNISGSTSNQLTIVNVSDADMATYVVVVSNSIGSVTSSNATLTVIDPPVITAQPTSQQTLLGSSAPFSVSVSGTPPFQFQWQFNLTNILNATNATYMIPAVAATDAGFYSVTVTNMAGGVTSSNALLTVIIPPTVSLQFLNGSPVLNVSGMLSNNFVVQYNTDLTTTNWMDLISISNLTSSPYQFVDPDGIDQPVRFYRVIMR